MTATHWEIQTGDFLLAAGWIIRNSQQTPPSRALAVLLGQGPSLEEQRELLRQTMEHAQALRDPRIAETCARLLRMPDAEFASANAVTIAMLRDALRVRVAPPHPLTETSSANA